MFVTEDSLKTHVYKVHNGKKTLFPCTYCVLGFQTKDSIKTHVERVHELFQFDKTEPILEEEEQFFVEKSENKVASPNEGIQM